MRLQLIASLALTLLARGEVATAAPIDPCALPQGLDSKISPKFQGAHLVSLADLDDYDRKLYKKDHGSRCPGLVKINFYGDGKPTWALVLISGTDPKKTKAELIVARQLDGEWDIRSLETTDGTPVVWREGPGKYEGMYGDGIKTIHATNPVIVFCGYGSWAIVYAWNGREVEKVWVSD
ncbi:MAG TPA: hypothetical protein VN943_02355 [Candidatus Acidoferrum sp.]|nr:hypothetical protein [Candidatus Acidoferrum sp.]